MLRGIKNVCYLSGKELRSLFSDPVLVVLIIYLLTVAIYTVANSISFEMKNASVGIVDNDHSALSYRLQQSLIEPSFRKVHNVPSVDVDRLMDNGEYTFILDIPPNYERDMLAGHAPQIQLLIDATAMTQAAMGANYISQIFTTEIQAFLHQYSANTGLIRPTINVFYNPNFTSSWFIGAMNVIGYLTLLSMLLVGSAVIRERERGTLEHILVMPVHAWEIAMAKIIANELVLLSMVSISIYLVVHKIIGVPLSFSAMGLFVLGAAVFIFAVASLGIMLAILAPTMPQFGLLVLPVYIVLYLLSGIISPIDNMPETVQQITQFFPTSIFGAYAQDVLFRDAPLSQVYPKLLQICALGALFLSIALTQFKTMLARQG